ncbi:MAG: hypothetical protein HY796_09645 [Elusimicrobia bacterium]|nr:hypothetical protein [Elusimicrobiota bacterium]
MFPELVKRGAALRAGRNMRGYFHRFFRPQLAVKINGKRFPDFLVCHVYSRRPRRSFRIFSRARESLERTVPSSAEAKDWYLKHCEMLWEGKRDKLIADIQKLSEHLGPATDGEPEGSPRKVLRQNAYSYFPNNRDAIDYPAFRSRGWPIGSGVVEAGVKQFAVRMKGSEKFWNIGGDTETGAE